MIRITQLKLPIEHKKQELYEKTAKLLRVAPSEIKQLKIVKQCSRCQKKGADLIYLYRRCGSGKRAADLKESEK